ncbi:exosome complex exonuclease DIS3/RRP44 [Nematocida ausubeli]|nr:exosome complex exonuclease DIS3/RRP44 [Nematocida ausubeli]
MDRIYTSYRQNKKGEIFKIPSQIYLSRNLPCGFGCCGNINPRIQESLQHSSTFYIASDEFLNDFVSFIETKSIRNVILTRTALLEIKKKYMNTHRRLEMAIDRYNLFVLEDIYSEDIYTYNKERKSAVDCSYYEMVSMWYGEHIKECTFMAVHSQKEVASKYPEGLFLSTQFSTHLPEISIREMFPTDEKYNMPYMSMEEVAELKDRVEVGFISIEDRDSGGVLLCNIEGHQIRIEVPREHLNRAIDRDYVIVEVLKEAGDIYIGRVVSVERRNRKPFPCRIIKALDESMSHVLLEPEMNNLPNVICQLTAHSDSTQHNIPDIMARLEKSVLLVVVEEWYENEKYPIGYIIKETGEKESIEAETAALLAHHAILDQAFEEAAQAELPSENWQITQKDLAEREDLRDYPIASIDPEGCIDIDDALHAKYNTDGTIDVGVHIADVTHFVKEDSHLDREGRIRGCTTYLPNRRIDMLPPLLGTNLCSLHENVDRLAFSVVWKVRLDQDKVVFLDRRFVKSIIRSKVSFTYDQASAVLKTGQYSSQEILNSVQLLKKISVLLKKSRLETGAFVIHSDECRISARNDKYFKDILRNPAEHIITEDSHTEEYDTHSLVEEFMLLANQHVATFISSVYPKESLIRIHPRPSTAAFKELETALSRHTRTQVVLDPQQPSVLSNTLKAYSTTDELKSTIGAWATKCMTQAVYSPSSIGCKLHYGLAMENYTHFTSPIRRYADVIVHRILYSAIHREKYSPITETRLERICDSVNRSYRNAKMVARHANQLYVRYLIMNQMVTVVIVGISSAKVEVYLPYYGINGILCLPESLAVVDGCISDGRNMRINVFSSVKAVLVPEVRKVFAFNLAA